MDSGETLNAFDTRGPDDPLNPLGTEAAHRSGRACRTCWPAWPFMGQEFVGLELKAKRDNARRRYEHSGALVEVSPR